MEVFKKNQERIGKVLAIGSNGEGIVKDEGCVAFVPFALTGEKIKYKVLKVKDKIAYGKLIEVLTPAENRIRPKCPYFTKCGGCQLQHLKYTDQIKIKETTITDCFRKIAGIDINLNDTVKGDSEWGYRNKLQLPVTFNGEQTQIGFYAENSHRVIPIKTCYINPSWTQTIISIFNEYITKYDIIGYNELENSGDIREITVKQINNNLLITVVSLSLKLKFEEQLVELLKQNLSYNFSLYVNKNDKKTNVIYGEEFRLICGEPSYSAEMLGIKYNVGVRSFTQVNDSVCKKLYTAVKNAVCINDDTVVFDAYSGAGLMTALLSQNAKKAIGIEIIPEATALADKLMLDNKLKDKVTNYCAKCEDVLPELIAKEKQNGSKISVVLDPPRKGCDYKVIEAVKNSGADVIAYVSCLPSSLARDVGLIMNTLKIEDGKMIKNQEATSDYIIESVTPFEMFANTKHIETLVVLKRKQ